MDSQSTGYAATMRVPHSLLTVLIILPLPSMAAQSLADQKRDYHPFSPVPNSLMRDLSAERPGVTESPTTLDAGHFQIDTGLVEYSFDDRGDERAESWTALETTLGVGITRRTAAQLILTPYVHEETGSSTKQGFGDLTLRLKMNLWGNDPEPGQRTAFGIIP
jgi:hypothetical protein